MLMPFVVALCLTLMLLSIPQRDWLVRRAAEARAALRNLRHAVRQPDYGWMVDTGVPQLEAVCRVVLERESGAAAEVEEQDLVEMVQHQARTLWPLIDAHVRSCCGVAALVHAAAPVAPLRAGDLRRRWLRIVALVDAGGRHVLGSYHLRLHLWLLRFGLERTFGKLQGARLPLRPAHRRLMAERGADLGTLARASVKACAALLQSPAVLLHQPPPPGASGRTHVM
jgi:hypothetical protein